MNSNTIAFRKRIIVPSDDYQDNRIMVSTVNAELMNFGYILSEEAFDALSKSDAAYIKDWANDIIKHLKSMMADGNDWKPLHSGFPETVMNATMVEIYMQAIIHYWTDGTWMPDEELVKEYKYEYTEFKPIKLGDEVDFMKIFTSLVSINQSITPIDMKIVEWFADNYEREILIKYMPETIPFKENLTVLASKRLPVPIKTPSDVLRIAHYMSHGFTDLFIPPLKIKLGWEGWKLNPERMSRKFKTFSYPERRHLLSLLEGCAYVKEMVRNYGQWIRLGEKLHPGEFRNRYPKAFAAYTKLRRTKVRSWYSEVNRAFEMTFRDGINKVAERPGEFGRRLDWMLRDKPRVIQEMVLKKFEEVGVRISNKVLFELMQHFKDRIIQRPRSVFVKGARIRTPLSTLAALPQKLVEDIEDIIWAIFFKKFESMEPLGAVWIDEDLKNIPAPTNMRTVSDQLVVTVRGQRIPFTVEKKFIRLYTHWTNGTDIDLSCEFGMKNSSKTAVCAFHDLGGISGIYHSGDVIPSTAGKWAEYIDIDVEKCKFDYALLMVKSYRSIPFNKLNCIAGMMERDTTEKSANWYPKTVVNSMKLQSQATTTMAFLFDLTTMEWIPVDEDVIGIPVATGSRINHVVKLVAEIPKVSVWHILKMHANARGHIVTDPLEADILFKFKDFKESYEAILKYML